MIPVYINNHNWCDSVKKLVADFWRLDSVTPIRITIVDNGSTNPELMEWYDELIRKPQGIRIIAQGNHGPRGYWRCMDHSESFYVVCDPDVDISECPNDLLKVLKDGLLEFPVVKTGPSIRIDDLPDGYPFKERVVADEGKYFTKKRSDMWWEGLIDTAFAMCRTGASFDYGPALRAAAPYQMRHRPWYEIPGELSSDMKYYLENLPPTHKHGMVWSTLMHDAKVHVSP